jgi:hypothetical protein
MTDHDTTQELTPEERAAFAALPRERIPAAALEERTVGTLRAEGLLRAPEAATRPAPRTAPRGVLRRARAWRVAAAAAGVALFATGVAVGQWRAGRAAADAFSAALQDTADPARAATEVQEAGSEYVRAVANLAALAGGGGGDVASGTEAARVALHAAALELARLSPDDPTLRLVLAVLEERAGAATDSVAARKTIWF